MADLRIDCGTAAVALRGELEIGDDRVVAPLPQGLLAAVMDGLGHGPAAALASQRAAAVIQSRPTAPVEELAQLCHDALRGTRGVVMSLAAFNLADRTMTWLGIGNVTGVLLRGEEQHRKHPHYLTARAGVVGDMLPVLVPETVAIGPGDTLVLATDGVAPGFATGGLPEAALMGAQRLANQILLRSALGGDDALVLVARCLPAASGNEGGMA